jgi:hypothetical protein
MRAEYVRFGDFGIHTHEDSRKGVAYRARGSAIGNGSVGFVDLALRKTIHEMMAEQFRHTGRNFPIDCQLSPFVSRIVQG